MTGRLYRTTALERAQTAPEHWASQYYSHTYRRDPKKGLITEELRALPDSERTPERVNAIIGNDSWTHIYCDICEDSVSAATVVAPRTSYFSFEICDACWTNHALIVRDANNKSDQCK